jgi:opacity protein-like surface antigen
MKKLIFALAAAATLVSIAAAAQAQGRCQPYCRPVPNGSGGMVTVCTCN